MKLVVAEKPSVARAIAEAVGASTRRPAYFEGNGYWVSWCFGHMVELAEPGQYCEAWANKDWRIEVLPMIPETWQWVVKDSCEAQFGVLADLMVAKDVEKIICATDADREGEGIFRRVFEKVSKTDTITAPVLRLWTASLEPDAILSALANAKADKTYDGLADAAKGRALADWLVGMNASRAYGALYRQQYSVGRVQTPTLAMVVARDMRIAAFVPEPYQVIKADLGGFYVRSERLCDVEAAERLAVQIVGKRARVLSVESVEKCERPPRLYDLTTLQKDASALFGYTAAQSLAAAQTLYEAKIMTYPRTDSCFITEGERADVDTFLTKIATAPLSHALGLADIDVICDSAVLVNTAKVEGHHAILPTLLALDKDVSSLDAIQLNLLMLVVFRLIAAVSEIHSYCQTRALFDIEGHEFTATGKEILTLGHKRFEVRRKVSDEESDGDTSQMLPELRSGQIFEVVDAVCEKKKTKPPKYYTDDTLLTAMQTCGKDIEDRALSEVMRGAGLGTPATRAGIIEALEIKGFIARNGRKIVSTSRGRELISLVQDDLKSPELTGGWELALSRIERGEEALEVFLDRVREYTAQIVRFAEDDFNPGKLAECKESVGICPLCGGKVVEGHNNFGCVSNVFEKAEKGDWQLVSGCGFSVRKMMCGKTLGATTVRVLLEKGRTGVLKNFTSRSAKKFDACLVIKDGKVVFEFSEKISQKPNCFSGKKTGVSAGAHGSKSRG